MIVGSGRRTPQIRRGSDMVIITFVDRDAEKRALGFLLGRFSGRVVRSGEHIVPEAAHWPSRALRSR
jgi:hypothetical protein